MTQADAKIEQRVVPMLSYADVSAAVEWLRRAFGFEERVEHRFTDPDGRVTHAEIELDGAVVMLGWPGPDYEAPADHARSCDRARRWLSVPYVVDGVAIYLDDVDAHFERAKAEGAMILREPMDQPPGRRYNVADLEGHRWMFIRERR